MKVAELIERLSKLPSDAVVLTHSADASESGSGIDSLEPIETAENYERNEISFIPGFPPESGEKFVYIGYKGFSDLDDYLKSKQESEERRKAREKMPRPSF